jgi:copper chaperone CopZ
MSQISKFKLSGLTCIACEKLVSKKLQTIDGVERVIVSLQESEASLMAPRAIVEKEVLIALEGTHYKVISI